MVDASDLTPSVWEDIYPNPANAELMGVRADAMTAVRGFLVDRGWDDVESARRLGLTLPRLRDLKHGRLHAFSLEDLVRAATKAGLRVHLDIQQSRPAPGERSSD